MSNGLSPKNVQLPTISAIGASVTATPVTYEFGLSHLGSLNLRLDIEASAAAGTVTAKIQHRSPQGSFEDLAGANASVLITGAGTFSIRQNIEIAADQPNMPIRKMCRLVITTAAASSVTLSNIWIQQGL